MKISITLLFILSLISCTKKVDKYVDGNYCADVYYYKHKNGKRFETTTPVMIENNHLVKFEDEWLKEIIFEPQLITNDTATFTTEKDEFIGVLLLGRKNCNEYLEDGE